MTTRQQQGRLIFAAALLCCGTTTASPAADLKADYTRSDSATVLKDIDDELIQLGRTLFFDPRLSGSNDLSCHSCHNSETAFEEPKRFSLGHKGRPVSRHTPTVANLAWGAAFNWDGRANSLAEQALMPVAAAAEMNQNLDELVREFAEIEGYAPLIEAAYGDAEVSAERLAEAIAAFEKTLITQPSDFDRWVAGDDNAIDDDAKAGFVLFNGKANCSACHEGWRFTDDSFHDIGVASDDRGRGEVMEEQFGMKLAKMEHAFKTPTLSNIAHRAPYLHDGSAATLREVVELYNRGGDVDRPSLSDEIKPLALSEQEIEQLVAFLQTLNGRVAPIEIPQLPE